MIRPFRCAETEQIFHGIRARKFRGIAQIAYRRLAFLDATQTLTDLARIPGHHLGFLGDRAGQGFIRINDQYRICFTWMEPDAFELEIVDYHYQGGNRLNAKTHSAASSRRNDP